MAYSDDAAEQVVKIALEGTEMAARITGAGAKQVAILLYAVLKDQKRTKGKTRLTTMLRSGKELKVFSVKDEDLKKFCQQAKKYGVLYCVLKDRDATDGITEIMVKAEDASKVNRIFTRNNLSSVDLASVRSELEQSLANAEDAPPPPVHPGKHRSKEDIFLDALLAAPNQEQAQTENPTDARIAKSRQSEPSSARTEPAPDKARDMEKRPSVRQELKEIREELNSEAQRERAVSSRSRTTAETKAPQNNQKKKRNRKKHRNPPVKTER